MKPGLIVFLCMAMGRGVGAAPSVILTVPPTLPPIVTVTISGLGAEFHPLIKSWLDGLENASATGGATQSASTIPSIPSTPCLTESETSKLLVESQCLSEVRTVISAQKLCRRVFDPLREMSNLPLKERYEYETDNLESLVDMVGSLLAHVGLPEFFISERFRQSAELIITKIRFATYTKEHAALEKSFTQGQSDHRGCGQEHDAWVRKGSALLEHVSHHLSLIGNGPKMSLPYPLLTAEERMLTSTVVGALLWRVRGGGAYNKHDPAFRLPQFNRRKYLRDPIATLAELNGGPAYRWIGTSMMLPFFIKGYSQFFDMGHLPKHKGDCGTKAQDFANMTRRGLYFVKNAVQSLALEGYDSSPLEFAGRQIGACYLHAWDVMHAKRVRWSPAQPISSVFDPGGIAAGPLTWGELCFGAGLGLGLSETLLAGKTARASVRNLDTSTIEHSCEAQN